MSAVFGCTSGPDLRPVGETVDRIVSRLAVVADNDGRQPRYFAEGRMVVNTHTGRRQTPPMAREAAANLLDSALAIRDDGCSDSDLRSLSDLVRAIRQAERNDPLPPCAVAVAA